jgi:hypothetical protein
MTVTTPIDPTLGQIAAEVTAAGNDPLIQQGAAAVKTKIPVGVRTFLYDASITLGAVGVGGSAAAVVLNGNAQVIVGGIAALALALVAFLARTHLSDK